TVLLTVFAARWLGHGRATEFMLSCVALIYGVILLTPAGRTPSVATGDLVYLGYGNWLALPFLAKAALSGGGLVANISGWPGSRYLRFSGAFLGTLIWTWYVAKLALVEYFGFIGFPFCLMASLVSVRIMAMSLADLPKPGAPGEQA